MRVFCSLALWSSVTLELRHWNSPVLLKNWRCSCLLGYHLSGCEDYWCIKVMHGAPATLALYYYRCESACGNILGIKEDDTESQAGGGWQGLLGITQHNPLL